MEPVTGTAEKSQVHPGLGAMPTTLPGAHRYHNKPQNSGCTATQAVSMLPMTSQEQLELATPLQEALLHPGSCKLGLELPSQEHGCHEGPSSLRVPGRELEVLIQPPGHTPWGPF